MFLNVKTVTRSCGSVLIEFDHTAKTNQVLFDAVSDKIGLEIKYIKLIFAGDLIQADKPLLRNLHYTGCIYLVFSQEYFNQISILFGVSMLETPLKKFQPWSFQLLLHELNEKVKEFNFSSTFIQNLRKKWENMRIRNVRIQLDVLSNYLPMMSAISDIYNPTVGEMIMDSLINLTPLC